MSSGVGAGAGSSSLAVAGSGDDGADFYSDFGDAGGAMAPTQWGEFMLADFWAASVSGGLLDNVAVYRVSECVAVVAAAAGKFVNEDNSSYAVELGVPVPLGTRCQLHGVS